MSIERYAVIETALCIGDNIHDGEVFMVLADEHDRELAELQATIANLRDELAELQDETDNHISAIERERVDLQAEVERLKGGQDEPVAWANSKDLINDGYSHSFTARSEQPGNNYTDGGVPVALYTSQPAPVSVVLPLKVQVVVPSCREEIGIDYMVGAAYNLAIDNCRKQIEASGLACIDKVKELNQ